MPAPIVSYVHKENHLYPIRVDVFIKNQFESANPNSINFSEMRKTIRYCTGVWIGSLERNKQLGISELRSYYRNWIKTGYIHGKPLSTTMKLKKLRVWEKMTGRECKYNIHALDI